MPSKYPYTLRANSLDFSRHTTLENATHALTHLQSAFIKEAGGPNTTLEIWLDGEPISEYELDRALELYR